MYNEVNLNITGSRKEIRKKLCLEFIKEKPGTGTGDDSSKYRYYVESVDGKNIYLNRPAILNNGFDFTVHVEDEEFDGCKKIKNRPTHECIIQDLLSKKIENKDMYKKVKVLINKIYDCKAIKQEEYDELHFKQGKSIEIILKVLKWLFIEQDITYWNYSGRGKLYGVLKDNKLC